MKENDIVTINSRKFDQHIHRSWQCRFVEETADCFVFFGEFESQINHKKLGVIRPGTVSYEYYWKTQYYNVFRFHEPNGEFRNFYCNINVPPVFNGSVVDYIDLDIDVLIWKDFSIEILDVDEYEENIHKYNYPVKLQEKALQSLDDLLKKINSKSFPFDIKL